MSTAEQIYAEVKALPEPLAREVLQFVTRLRERGGAGEERDWMLAQQSALAKIWDNEEDRVWDHL